MGILVVLWPTDTTNPHFTPTTSLFISLCNWPILCTQLTLFSAKLSRLLYWEHEYTQVWGCAWNLKPFSWAMKKNAAILLICHSFLICPSKSWPLGLWLLSVFKLVSCKPGASRELALRPPRPEKLQML